MNQALGAPAIPLEPEGFWLPPGYFLKAQFYLEKIQTSLLPTYKVDAIIVYACSRESSLKPYMGV